MKILIIQQHLIMQTKQNDYKHNVWNNNNKEE